MPCAVCWPAQVPRVDTVMSLPTFSGIGHVPVEGCLNFRDAGGCEVERGPRMRSGLLYRADDPIRLTPVGRATVESLDLAAVIDLRQHAQCVRSPGFVDPKRTFHRPLVDRVVDIDNPPKLDEPGDLADIYEGIILSSRTQIAEVLDIIAEHLDAGPVLVHCAYGKDRTGIIVALVQAALGMPADVLAREYGRSDEPVRRRYQWMIDEPLADDPPVRKVPAYLFTAPAAAMAELARRAVESHGSLADWVASLPVAASTIDRLRAGLVAD